jgi:hypothetical protein
MSSGRDSIPSQTDWLTVSRKVTWTWTWNCNTNAPFQGQQFHSQPANCNTNAPFQGQHFHSQLTATQAPFSGPAILQPASWHDNSFARLPWSPVTLIVNICGCLQISTSHSLFNDTYINLFLIYLAVPWQYHYCLTNNKIGKSIPVWGHGGP